MHYKRRAALLKMISKSEWRIDKVIFNICIDIHRYPDKYSTDEKLRVAAILYQNHKNSLLALNTFAKAGRAIRKGNPLLEK